MRPARPINDAANITAVEAHVVGNALMGFSAVGSTPDRSHKFIVQDCRVMPLSLFTSMSALVFIVLCCGSPFQIVDSIISRIPVYMERLHTIRARTNESHQNQMVNVSGYCPSDGNDLATVNIVNSRSQPSPFFAHAPSVIPAGPNRAVTARTVSLKSWYVSVFDVHSSIIPERGRMA